MGVQGDNESVAKEILSIRFLIRFRLEQKPYCKDGWLRKIL